jgi:adhesin transport system membrane fusion protein
MATPFARTHNALARETPRLALFALAVAAALLAIWLLWFTLASVTLYEVSTSARLEVGTAPRAVSPAQSGRMIATRLSIGRRVTAGDVLVSLDAEPQRLRLAEAERRMRDYPRRLASLDREMALLGDADSADRSSAAAATRAARARDRSRCSFASRRGYRATLPRG